MSMKNKSLSDFTEVLSSKAAVPGGGGACALGGALGVSLGSMVGNLTVGKKRYADVQEEIQETLLQSEKLRQCFLNLIDEDAECFLPLSKAYGLPENTEEEKNQKEAIMEEALVQAAQVPMHMMETALEGLCVLKKYESKGSRIAISDVGVGVAFLRASISGAAFNVYINTKMMKNRQVAEALNKRCDEMKRRGEKDADEIYHAVFKRLK